MNYRECINYVVLYLTIMASGNPAVDEIIGDQIATVSVFGLVCLVAFRKPIRLGRGRIFLVVGILFILLGHIAIFGQMVVIASIGFFILVLIGALLASSMDKVLTYFVNCMAFCVACSLPIHFLLNFPESPLVIFEPRIATWDGHFIWKLDRPAEYSSLWVQTFLEGTRRNSGPFWEPGAFAGYLVIALLCMTLTYKSMRYSKIALVLIIVGLLTTESTTGYLAMFVVMSIFMFSYFSGRNPLITFFLLPALLVAFLQLAFYAGENIPFIKDKIERQLEDVQEEETNYEINRFGNMQFDLKYIANRPFIGWSANVETRLELDPFAMELIERQGSALTGSMVRFGVVGWLLLMGGIFTSFLRLSSGSLVLGFAGLGVVWMTLVGEKFFNYPLIMVLLFLSSRHVVQTLVTRDSENRVRCSPNHKSKSRKNGRRKRYSFG